MSRDSKKTNPWRCGRCYLWGFLPDGLPVLLAPPALPEPPPLPDLAMSRHAYRTAISRANDCSYGKEGRSRVGRRRLPVMSNMGFRVDFNGDAPRNTRSDGRGRITRLCIGNLGVCLSVTECQGIACEGTARNLRMPYAIQCKLPNGSDAGDAQRRGSRGYPSGLDFSLTLCPESIPSI